MNATDLKTFRHRLVEMTRRLSGERDQLRHEVWGDQRDPKVSTIQEQFTTDDLSREKADEEVALSLLENEEGLLAQCLAALARIESGAFGRCEGCGRAISKARLEVAPYVRHCIRCARKAEPVVE